MPWKHYFYYIVIKIQLFNSIPHTKIYYKIYVYYNFKKFQYKIYNVGYI